MNFYYINDNHERLGPFTIDQLRAQNLTANTWVWCPDLGMQQWMPAGQVPQLAALFVPVQPVQQQPVEQPVQQQPIEQPVQQQPVEQPVQHQPVEQPVQQQPVQQPVQQPYQQQPYQQQPYQPMQQPNAQQSSSKKTPLIIAAAILALAVLGGLGWWWMNNRARTDEPIEEPPAVTAQTTDSVTTSEATVGEAFEPTEGAPIDKEGDDNEANEMDNKGVFAPRHAPSGSQGFSNMVLSVENLLRESGVSVNSFADMRALGKVNGNQILYEHSDGVRYQFFFDKPVKNTSAVLTGIAVSRKTDKAYTQCAELQDALEDRGYYETDTHLFSGDNGLTYSPGYKGNRVYCYIYRSNAPDKSPAPRE